MKIREKYHTRIGGMEGICECGSTKHIEFFMKEDCIDVCMFSYSK